MVLAKSNPKEIPSANSALTKATPIAAPVFTDSSAGNLATLKSVVTKYS